MEIVDAHVHLLPPRLAARVRRVIDDHLPGCLAYDTPDPHAVLDDLEAAEVGTAWDLPYARAPGVADWLIPSAGSTPTTRGSPRCGRRARSWRSPSSCTPVTTAPA